MVSRILLVDDEVNVTDGLRRSLRNEPLDILTASSAAEALELLAQNDVDVIVSDERMPQMSGHEFLACVRELYPESIRIMLSGQADLHAVVSAVNKGEIYRFLFKPCHSSELIATINQALAQKKLLDRSRWLLQEYKRQGEVIKKLDEAQLDLTKVDRDDDGAIMLKAEPLSLEELIEEISAEMREADDALDPDS